jgi:hypothetical protein
VTADQQPPPQHATATVDHRGAQVGQQVAVHWVPALVHSHEHVLDDVFPGAPIPEDERGQPDEFGLVLLEHLAEIPGETQRGFHIHDTNCARPRLPANAKITVAMVPPE